MKFQRGNDRRESWYAHTRSKDKGTYESKALIPLYMPTSIIHEACVEGEMLLYARTWLTFTKGIAPAQFPTLLEVLYTEDPQLVFNESAAIRLGNGIVLDDDFELLPL